MHFSLNGIIATAIALSVMVFIHELAHFIVAKACGVKVEVFSLGFGKRIVGFKHKETDYRISILPLGGYVKMAGEMTGVPGEIRADSTYQDGPHDTEGRLDLHPRWHHALIALAGPTANFLLAIVILTGVYMTHDEVSQYLSAPVVLDYVATSSLAAQAGFKTGDHVVSVDGVSKPTWEQFIIQAALGAKHKVPTEVDRNGQQLPLTFTPDQNAPGDDGFIPVVSDGPMKIDAIEPGMPAAKAGLQSGDEILQADDQPIHSIFAFIAYLQDHNQKPLDLTVKRGDQIIHLAMQPVMSNDGAGGSRYRIGVRPFPPPVHIEKQPLPAAMKHSVETNVANSGLIFEVLERMFTFRMSAKQVDGPIGIVRETSRAVEEPGWTPLLMLMAVISLNLGIVNLLPFPILDGGVILMLGIEGLMRRDVKPEVKERIYQGAFVVLVLLFMLLIFNDISKLSLFTHAKT
jgi:regulator of sigma E protease